MNFLVIILIKSGKISRPMDSGTRYKVTPKAVENTKSAAH
jgi:hypothetical protein